MLIDRNEIVPDMKKYIFTSSIILAFALVSNATIYEGGTGRSTVFLNGDDVVLKSGAGDKFNAGGNVTIHSLDGSTYSPTSDYWDIAYGTTIDINSAVNGEVMAVNFAGNNVQWRIDGFVIKNSNANASNTVATINAGKALRFVTNGASESAGIDIQTNVKFQGNVALTAQGGGSNFFSIAENCTVDYISGSMHVASRAHIDVASGAIFRQQGSINAYNGSTINVAKGATFETKTILYDANTTAITNVAGTLSFTGGTATVANINLTGSLYAKKLQEGTLGRLSITGANNVFGAGSKVEIQGAIEVKSGSLVIDEGCESIIVRDKYTSTGTLYEGRVILAGNASITYNKDNAVTRINEAGTKTFDKCNLLVTGANNKLFVNADVQYTDIRAFGGASDLTVVLSDNVDDILLFGRLTSDGSPLAISIENFSDNRVFIATNLSSPYIVDGTTISVDTGAEFEFVAGTYNSTKGFWLNAVAVPEPAEWAAIFGAIALGLAVYRRRK